MTRFKGRLASWAGAAILLSCTAQAGTLKTLFFFHSRASGSVPASLLYDNGFLYGTTLAGGTKPGCGFEGCGLLFKLDPSNGAETVLTSFKSVRGTTMGASLSLLHAGQFYGTSFGGGATDAGTVFRLDVNPVTKHRLYSFAGQDNINGQAQLVFGQGMLYGTTLFGGSASSGTLYALDPATHVKTTLLEFAGGDDGAFPNGLIYRDGMLFGVTQAGGMRGSLGIVYKFDIATGVKTNLHSFGGGSGGAYPSGGLALVGDELYVTTAYGGLLTCSSTGAGCGAILKLNVRTGDAHILYRFKGEPDDGSDPAGPVVVENGVLSGTTLAGGMSGANCPPDGCGTLFQIDTSSGAETALVRFTMSNGAYPTGLIYQGGVYYGLTSANLGSVYSFTP